MGVNMDKVRKRIKDNERKDAARQAMGARWWKPKQGRNNIRLMPPWTDSGMNAGEFAREVHTHWNVGEGDNEIHSTCPANTPDLGGECLICLERARLLATGDPVDLQRAHEIRATEGYVSNIVDLDDPTYTKEDYDEASASGREPDFNIGETKVQVFRYGPMIHKQLLDNFDAHGVDLTDIASGATIVLTKTGKGKTGTKYTATAVPTPSGFDFLGDYKVYDLEALNPPRDDADIRQALGAASVATQAALPPVATPPTTQIGQQVQNRKQSQLEKQMMAALEQE